VQLDEVWQQLSQRGEKGFSLLLSRLSPAHDYTSCNRLSAHLENNPHGQLLGFWYKYGINLVYTLDQVYTWYKSNINISVKLYKVYTLIKFSILCSILDIMG
jgi:hypothetical protein